MLLRTVLEIFFLLFKSSYFTVKQDTDRTSLPNQICSLVKHIFDKAKALVTTTQVRK